MLDKYRPHVKIELDNGVYVFDDYSSTGKTWLSNTLKELSTYGEPVNSYSYRDYVNGVDITDVLNKKYKVVMLDRYNLYNGYAKDMIKSLADSMVILLDCKGNIDSLVDVRDCDIDISENSIEVTE